MPHPENCNDSGQRVLEIAGEELGDPNVPVDQRRIMGRQIENLARATMEALRDLGCWRNWSRVH